MPRPTVLRAAALAAAVTVLAATAHAQILRRPAAAAWTPDSTVKSIITGGSAQLNPDPAVDPSIPRIWLTRAERSLWKQTSDYDEMMRYCRSLEAGSRWVKLELIGKSGQGRDLPMLILSKDRAFTPEAARALGKPVVLIQNGIHAGEIEGKDASMMLMRDMAALHKFDALLDSVTVLVLPVFSVDAAERRSHWNRINQNGPDEMGWRHTPVGLNLNRDYTKLDAPEMRALIGNVYTKWWPELLIDNHTTDGADYRYDVTYATNHGAGVPPSLDRWYTDAIEKGMVDRLAERGHLVSPYLDFKTGNDPRGGIEYNNSLARFSTGYPQLQSRAALLVETHMLKPYGSRVKATYDLMLSVLGEIHDHPRALMDAVRDAEAASVARAQSKDPAKRMLVLATGLSDKSVPVTFKGLQTTWTFSEITGSLVPHYSSAPWDTTVMMYRETIPQLSVRLPEGGYVVPQEFTDVLDRIALHGIRTRRLARAWSDTVEMTRITGHAVTTEPYEGRANVRVTAVSTERQLRSFRAGDVWVPLDQRGGALAATLLEAQSPDGFMAWGFFLTVFQRKEYGENYLVEPMARAMLDHDAKLAADFRTKLQSDTAFAKDPAARSDWFYRRSPWRDPEQDLHPIARALHPVPEGYLVPLPVVTPPAPAAPAGTAKQK
jgi:murein tripeptide amidase MpaA